MRKWTILLAALLLAGCAADTQAPVEVAETDNTAPGGKGDCVDCDPTGPSAFEQLGLGTGFWTPGQSWQVVYLLKTDDQVQMQPMGFGQEIRPNSGMVVLDFEVTELFTIEDGDVQRPAATIRISQTVADGSLRQFVEAVEIQADDSTNEIALTMDDLFRPIGVTEFTEQNPNGRYFEQDGDSVVRNTSNGFPYVVPNVHLDPATSVVPALPPELHVIAEDVRAGYDTEVLSVFELGDETVYWAEGDLWPFYVETPFAVGILTSQSR